MFTLLRSLPLMVLIALAIGAPFALAQDAAAVNATVGNPAVANAPEDNVVLPVRLLDRQPFDRITLDSANNGAVIETVLLEFPERRVPNPLPREGKLELRQINQQSIAYAVDWAAVAKVELFEQMLLAEAVRLTASSNFAEAFDYLAFLRTNYPELPGLEPALQEYLWRDASSAFAGGDGEGAWPALVALYERNPQFPRLANAVQAVSDGLITQRLAAKDYPAAHAVLALVEQHFPHLELANITRWREQFNVDAQEQLAAARTALAAGDFDAARAAAMVAEAILPELDEPREMLKEIQRAAPEIRVGVTQFGGDASPGGELSWAAARVAPLWNPRLVEIVDFGAEGGVYASRFGEISTNDVGLETTLQLAPASLRGGLTPDAVSLAIVDAASSHSALEQVDFAAALAGLRIAQGNEVIVDWRRPLLHPEAFLQTPLRRITTAERGPGLWLDRQTAATDADIVRYVRTGSRKSASGRPQIVVERLQADDDAALATLARGEVDAIDRVPPWQVEQARQTPGLVVGSYALPTVHVLIPNLDNRLLAMREFRRALCYGADRQGIVRDILLGGNTAEGFVALSGPFPAGSSLNDPVGYAYHSDLARRPYEPRLAALLANVARTTLAKRELEERKARGEEVPEPDPTVEPTLPPATPLVLAHPADPLARVACQALKLQFDRVNIPVKLVELPADDPDASVAFDLLYAELTVWEPLTDARRLLGADGLAGRSSALMTAALEILARSENWNDARNRLREIHRIAHFDLPLIPLWQTENYFAHRTWLTGVGERPLTLYQNLDNWRKEFDDK